MAQPEQEEVRQVDMDYVPVETALTEAQRRDQAHALFLDLRDRLRYLADMPKSDRLRIFDAMSGLESALHSNDKNQLVESISEGRQILGRVGKTPDEAGYSPLVDTSAYTEQESRDSAAMYEVRLLGLIEDVRQAGGQPGMLEYARQLAERLHDELERQPLNQMTVNELLQEAERVCVEVESHADQNR